MSKAVVDGVLHHVSPSQVKTYDACPRKWFLEKVAHVGEVADAAQIRGQGTHTEVENYLLDNVPIEDLSMRDLVEEGHSRGFLSDQERFVEFPLSGLEAAGIPVEGRIDLWIPEGPVHIIDWKTTSDIKRYGKKPPDLWTDVQMQTYGFWAFGQIPGKSLQVALAYAQTKGRKHAWVTQTLRQKNTTDWWQDIFSPTVADMARLAGRDPADFGTVQPVFSRATCRAYNRLCPAAGWCGEEALRAAGYQTLPEGMSRPETRSTQMTHEDPTMPSLTVVPPALDIPPGALILFVDCAPSKSLTNIPVTYLEDVIAARTPGILAEIRATEPKLVPANAVDVLEVQFARGKGAMVASFRRTPLTGYVCARNTGLAAEIVEVLTSQAGLVIRGN